MKSYLILFAIATLLIGCNKNAEFSNEVLKSILKIDDLSEYDHEHRYVRDFYDNYPYTIYYRIKIDSMYFNNIIKTNIENCIPIFNIPFRKFESIKVAEGDYSSFSEKDIPDWFNVGEIGFDTWAGYDTKKLKIVKCDDEFDSWFLMKYSNGNCYLILDSVP